MKCDSGKDGTHGCHARVCWVLKGADFKMYSCGAHLNRVALQMVSKGLAFMTLSIEEME